MDDLSNELNLHISCSNLRKADVMSKSDPIVLVSLEMENKVKLKALHYYLEYGSRKNRDSKE